MNENVIIITKDGKLYLSSNEEIDRYLKENEIKKYHTVFNKYDGLMYYYIDEDYEQKSTIQYGTYEDLIASDAIWEDDEETLFEDFCLSWHDPELNAMEALHEGLDFVKYDIVFAEDLTDPNTLKQFDGHRIFVVDAIETQKDKDENGRVILNQTYSGYMLSTQVKQASINNLNDITRDKNIYIDDYNSILDRGKYYTGKRPIYIDLNKRYVISRKDISQTGAWKGHANRKFIDFINELEKKKDRGEDISRYYWENGPQYLEKEKR